MRGDSDKILNDRIDFFHVNKLEWKFIAQHLFIKNHKTRSELNCLRQMESQRSRRLA